MPALRLVADDFGSELEAGFAAIRSELGVPMGFPDNVVAEAESVAHRGPAIPDGAATEVADRRDLPLVTIDPPTSTDLDQAFAATQTDTGYRVYYAIADVASFVAPGGALDTEARSRGVTLYSPDQRASLHPEILNENAGSLLPGTDKPALLWQIDLDEAGNKTSATLARATVSSDAKLSYGVTQRRIDQIPEDAGPDDDPIVESLRLLRVIGRLRQQLESDRGAISLQLPSQEIKHLPNGDYELGYEASLPVEGWNAQISLLTGIAAAELMVEAGHGLLRTLPPLHDRTVSDVRRAAKALGVDWPEAESYPDRVRRLDPNQPAEAALLVRAARSFQGAGYEPFFNGELPEQPLHGAIASIYTHVTAPLRRVCDRFSNEIVLAHCAGIDAPAWALEALEELPSIMGTSRQKDRSLERATVDFVEAVALKCLIGEEFEGMVLSHRRRGANVQLRNPAVLAGIGDQPDIGDEVRLILNAVDLDARKVEFSLVDGPTSAD